eukprot:COSAG04_NODE_5326_length_1655_cov_1.688303_2_plen_101_part_00
MTTVPARMYLPAGHGVYYTSKGSVVYALAMGWPEGNSLLLRTPVPSAHVAVSMLGCDKPMTWVRSHRPLGILRKTLDLTAHLSAPCPNRNALKPSLCSSE